MKKLEFKTSINASAEKVWNALWAPENYKKWTSVFSPESQAISDWKEGSEILFTDGSRKNGMKATIESKKEPNEMIFHHHGELKDGILVENDNWKDAKEAYFIKEQNGISILTTTMDTTEEFEQFFSKTFLKGLEIVKEIAEK